MSAYEAGSTAGTHTKKDELKERAVDAASEVDAGAKHVAGVAGDEVGNVAHTAKSAARGFFDETRTQLTEQASHQQRRAAGSLRSTGDQLVGMAQSADSDGVATGIVRTVGQKTRDAASWLDQREPGDLVHEVRGFARRHTGAFLLIAVGVGVVAGRLTRALMSNGDGSSSTGASTGSSRGTGAAAGYPMAAGTSGGQLGGAATGAGSTEMAGVGTNAGWTDDTGTAGAGMAGAGMAGAGMAGAGTAGAGTGTVAGETPIGDAIADRTSAPSTDEDLRAGLVTEGETAQDEWSPSGEARR